MFCKRDTSFVLRAVILRTSECFSILRKEKYISEKRTYIHTSRRKINKTLDKVEKNIHNLQLSQYQRYDGRIDITLFSKVQRPRDEDCRE